MWYVYLLLCSDGSFYTGASENPQQRYLDHKNGKGGAYTKGHKPIRLVYVEPFESKKLAIKRELQIKGWTRKKKIRILKLQVLLFQAKPQLQH